MRRQNIALLSLRRRGRRRRGRVGVHERDVRAPARVVFNPFDRVFPRREAVEIDGPDPAFSAVAPVAHPDLAAVVAAADVLAFAREGEGQVGAAAVEVVVDGAAEVSDSRGAGFVGAELEGRFGRVFGADGGFIGVHFGLGAGCCDGGWGPVIDCLSFGVGAEGGVGEESPEVLDLTETYSWLEHCRVVLEVPR